MDKQLIFAHPARVLTRATNEQLMALAKDSRAFDPSVFEDHPPFFWAAEISSDRLDAYFTRMSTSSLNNYANEAAAGVSFQNSHASYELGFGRSLTGIFEPAGESGGRVVAEFYTIPGLRLNGVATDDLILGIRSGIVKDVSIGFYGGEFICSLCNVDMFDWDAGCKHWPGDEVEIKDPQTGDVVRKETVFAWVVNAHLSEVSAVYDGATPGAAILKAEQLSEAGELRPEAARVLEQRYRHLNLRFPDARYVVPVGKIPEPKQEARTMTDDNTKPKEETRAPETITRDPRDVEMFNGLRSLLTEAGFAETQEIPAAIRALKDEVVTLRAANAEIPTLRKQAADGEAYRKSLIDDVVKEGIRAMGADAFDETGERALLENADLEIVKRKATSYRSIGDKIYGGGRQTTDEIVEPSLPESQNRKPDAAYRVS